VYSRADLPRTVAIVVALFLTAISTSAVAREFRATDTQSEDHPTVQARRYMGRLIAENSGRAPPPRRRSNESARWSEAVWQRPCRT
jgi:hypothetical protein